MRKRGEYDRAFRTGRSRHTGHFRLVVAPTAGPGSRVGVVVGKKVGKAHDRNRVKRLVREFFRRNRARLTGPLELVVVAKPGAAALASQAALQELEDGLRGWLRGSPPEP